ncbi:hypothetical protein HPULCUR_010544 [Helicostylum pulchrum]|uniref:Uncharacterized protein n=1 Tax=Helicostylum pulchrum TaxID=562976 RepID=A0ABP9YDJ4_9FUNG
MRAFSSLFVTAALALSANAATNDPQIQLCMDDLTAANAQLAIVKGAVDTFARSQDYPGAITIHNKEQILEQRLTTAGNTCCAVNIVAATADANAFLSVVNTMVPLVQGALASIVSKRPEFDAIFLATSIVKTDIKNLNNQANQLLDNCLFDVTPPSHTAIATTHVTVIKSAFATAKTAYGI